jgi:hypothetical protein
VRICRCSPGAYHVFLYLLNDVLRDAKLGNAAGAPPRTSLATAQAAARMGGSGDEQRIRWVAGPQYDPASSSRPEWANPVNLSQLQAGQGGGADGG